MKSAASTVEAYLEELPPDRRRALSEVRRTILEHLPAGYQEQMQFGMIGYGIPLARYPHTYNKQPLALAALASQKRYMVVYLNSVYADPEEAVWFTERYARSGKNLDMGKSCVYFRKLEDLPLDVVAEEIARWPVERFIARYEAAKPARPRKAPPTR
jgi:hypothetical protein